MNDYISLVLSYADGVRTAWLYHFVIIDRFIFEMQITNQAHSYASIKYVWYNILDERSVVCVLEAYS